MYRKIPQPPLSHTRLLTTRAFVSLKRFVHVEAASGIVLLIAAAIALIWANAPFASSYHAIWHLPISLSFGNLTFSKSLHFIINDALMSIFFLVVGMEIRRETYEGTLKNFRQASLPVMAASGGVIVPALIYLGLNTDPSRLSGWAVPTATDIAFAVGILALLGRGIPTNTRVFLLTLAIIDDIIAVLIIALFYSGGLNWYGFLIAGLGTLGVLGFQRLGIGSALAYVLPGAIIWTGLLIAGTHPTLAGVVLGMMTPVVSMPMHKNPLGITTDMTQRLCNHGTIRDISQLAIPLKHLQLSQRELLPPVVRVQTALHPWVAFGIMPLFALANAGVSMNGIDLSNRASQWVTAGIVLALVLGKPLGIVCTSWLVVRSGWCPLPSGMSWNDIVLTGLLAGIGFTMSIFIAMLAFGDPTLLGAAKIGVLIGSMTAALFGLTWGILYQRKTANPLSSPVARHILPGPPQ